MSKKSSNSCTIKVLEKEYNINCGEAEKEMLLKSADLLNKRVKETRASGGLSGGEKIMVMTALNICYDYLNGDIAGSDITDGSKVETEETKNIKKLQKLNKKIESALHQHQQIELS